MRSRWKADARVDGAAPRAEAADMSNQPSVNGRTFGLSVLVGAFGGISLQLILSAAREPIEPSAWSALISEWWALPLVIFAYGSIAVPFVALGLAVFGLPISRLLRRQSQEWWVGVVAVLWGAVAGKLTFYAIDHLMFFGYYELVEIGLYDPGLIFGIPTAWAWWLLHRRELTPV